MGLKRLQAKVELEELWQKDLSNKIFFELLTILNFHLTANAIVPKTTTTVAKIEMESIIEVKDMRFCEATVEIARLSLRRGFQFEKKEKCQVFFCFRS